MQNDLSGLTITLYKAHNINMSNPWKHHPTKSSINYTFYTLVHLHSSMQSNIFNMYTKAFQMDKWLQKCRRSRFIFNRFSFMYKLHQHNTPILVVATWHPTQQQMFTSGVIFRSKQPDFFYKRTTTWFGDFLQPSTSNTQYSQTKICIVLFFFFSRKCFFFIRH